jgi:hypothetical protein
MDEQAARVRGDENDDNDDEVRTEWSEEEEENEDDNDSTCELVAFQDTSDWRRQLLNEEQRDSVQFYYIDTTDSVISCDSGMSSSTVHHNGLYSCLDMSCL